MTTQELLAKLAPVDLGRLAVIFDYIADHMHEARLITGERLNDQLDFSAWMRELAARARFLEGTGVLVEHSRPLEANLRQRGWGRTCPDCHHEHEGKTECLKYLGEEKFCHCESKVTA